MKVNDFDYCLPEELIAAEPTERRDQSKLMILDKQSGKIEHRIFSEIVNYLRPDDLLVLNDSKVIPARLIADPTSRVAEIFLSKRLADGSWECLIKGRARVGSTIVLSPRLTAVVERLEDCGTRIVRFNLRDVDFFEELQKIGQIPLPPYIVKKRGQLTAAVDDRLRYQTVYADDNRQGSVAAPTAGLHFTQELLAQLQASGVEIVKVTLHVGLGTFLPVKTEKISDHQMHSEWAQVSAEAAAAISRAKLSGRRVIAVGTTSARTLEFFAATLLAGQAAEGWDDIFIYPPYDFKIVDGLLTNFHLPKSTLLMLVSALAGKSNIEQAYREAINHQYRFYSYGDAMLIK